MPENYAELHRNIKFTNNVTQSLREESGMMAMLCGSSGDYAGSKSGRIENRFGRLQMNYATGRNSDTDLTDPNSVVRFIKFGPAGIVGVPISDDDQNETEVELTSPLTMEVAEAARQFSDDMWGGDPSIPTSSGYFGNAWEGEDGSIAVPFKGANILAHGGAGVTLARLLAIRKLAQDRHCKIKKDPLCMLLTPADEVQLLNIPEYKSADFNSSKPLVDGEIKPFLDIRFFSFAPDLATYPKSNANYFSGGGTVRRLPVFQRSGLHRGVKLEFKGRLGERPDKNYDLQAWGKTRSAVVRTDEDKCFIFESFG
jgi:Phage capsid protein